MSDWNTTQPAPQGVEPGTAAPICDDTEPMVGYQDARDAQYRPDGIVGEPIPPSNRKMH